MLKHDIEKTYRTEIITAIKNRSDLVFISYSGLEDTEEKIKFALAKILERSRKEELFTPIISCIKELIANATKANAKMILINEGKIKNLRQPDRRGQADPDGPERGGAPRIRDKGENKQALDQDLPEGARQQPDRSRSSTTCP